MRGQDWWAVRCRQMPSAGGQMLTAGERATLVVVNSGDPGHCTELAGVQQGARVGRQEGPLHVGLHTRTERERGRVDGPHLTAQGKMDHIWRHRVR